jgi:hypothetical protein
MGWYSRMVKSAAPGRAGKTGPTRKGERVTLDFATWRAHLAAPGSTFTPLPSASSRIVRLDPLIRATEPADAERRTA